VKWRMVTLSYLMERYPNPAAGPQEDDLRYCVGGALCRWYGLEVRMPSAKVLAEVLKQINPTLENPYPAAYKIIAANDRGNFAKAWELLGKALPEVPEIAAAPAPVEEEQRVQC
jgi:hypothetical protein